LPVEERGKKRCRRRTEEGRSWGRGNGKLLEKGQGGLVAGGGREKGYGQKAEEEADGRVIEIVTKSRRVDHSCYQRRGASIYVGGKDGETRRRGK